MRYPSMGIGGSASPLVPLRAMACNSLNSAVGSCDALDVMSSCALLLCSLPDIDNQTLHAAVSGTTRLAAWNTNVASSNTLLMSGLSRVAWMANSAWTLGT